MVFSGWAMVYLLIKFSSSLMASRTACSMGSLIGDHHLVGDDPGVSDGFGDVPVVVAPGHPVAGVTARTGDLADHCAYDAVGAEVLRRLVDAVVVGPHPRLATKRVKLLVPRFLRCSRTSSAVSTATGSTSVTSSSVITTSTPKTSHPSLLSTRFDR